MIEVKNLDVIFGKSAERALPMLDSGKGRDEILERTGLVVGVKGANFRVEKGEICVLMGLSGSGKSSLLRCINGLNPVARGEINIEYQGKVTNLVSADESTKRELRMKSISMVFQKFALMPWLTVEKNVAMPLEMQKLDKSDIKERVSKQLDLVGLAEWAQYLPSQLSGGMQQRVGLARALVSESNILLMDEPFSALDPLIRSQLQDELIRLQETLNKTIIFVSHDLDEALKLGNRIAIMKDGAIVQHGTPQEIVMSPADDYVSDFVAHINPLNVLLAKDLMRAASAEEQNRTDTQCWYQGDSIPKLKPAFTVVKGNTTMRDVMAIRLCTGQNVLVEDQSGIVGVIGDIQLYQTLLGEPLTGQTINDDRL